MDFNNKNFNNNSFYPQEEEYSQYNQLIPPMANNNMANAVPPTSAPYVNTQMNTQLNELPFRQYHIAVIGVGGAGNNAVDRITQLNIEGVETIAINTDVHHLLSKNAHKRLLIGKETTGGSGAGNEPEIGAAAARESLEEIKSLLNADMIFIVCGLGGGTGTGAGPIVAKAAKEKGILTVAVCTLPFKLEGSKRYQNAVQGLQKITEVCDTVILVPNEKLLSISENLTMLNAFQLADEILIRAVKAVAELINKPQLINLDQNDVRTVLSNSGVALISFGESNDQQDKIKEVVDITLKNPLLDDLDISTASRALICVAGGKNLQITEVERVGELVRSQIDPNAHIIWGATVDPELNDKIRLIVILSDLDSAILNGDFYYDPNVDPTTTSFLGSGFFTQNRRSNNKTPTQQKRNLFFRRNADISSNPQENNTDPKQKNEARNKIRHGFLKFLNR